MGILIYFRKQTHPQIQQWKQKKRCEKVINKGNRTTSLQLKAYFTSFSNVSIVNFEQTKFLLELGRTNCEQYFVVSWSKPTLANFNVKF